MTLPHSTRVGAIQTSQQPLAGLAKASSLVVALMGAALVMPCQPLMAQSNSADSTAGGKGAKTYCFMRSAGNTHKVSWEAAYALIKRQSASLFKTSPEHASVMITEAVVNNPSSFPDCSKYLGDLYVK